MDTGLNRAPKSARLRIFVIVNGRSQGLADLALHGNLNLDATQSNSATLRTSQNVLGGLPAATPNGGIYDPFWDVYIGAWTPAAIAAGKNIVLTSSAAIQKAVAAKLLTGPGGKPFGPVGFAVNCPVVAIEQ